MNKQYQNVNVSIMPRNNNVVPLKQERILVPINTEECAEKAASWLQSNPLLAQSCILLVHVIEQDWISEGQSGIPYLYRLHEQELEFRTKQQMLQRVAQRLQAQFETIKIDYKIEMADNTARAIGTIADDWGADVITVFSTPRKRLFFFSDNSLSREIMDKAKRTVLVIQEPQTPSTKLSAR